MSRGSRATTHTSNHYNSHFSPATFLPYTFVTFTATACKSDCLFFCLLVLHGKEENGSKWNSFDMMWPFDTDDSITRYLNRMIVFIVVLICLNYWNCSFRFEFRLIEIWVQRRCGTTAAACVCISVHWITAMQTIHSENIESNWRTIEINMMIEYMWDLIGQQDACCWKEHIETFNRAHKGNRPMKQTKRKRHICVFPVYWKQALSSRTAKFH